MVDHIKELLRPRDRHNLVLRVAGTYFFFIGISIHFYVPHGPRWDALVVARSWMPLDYWGYVFMAVGLLVVLTAVRTKGHLNAGYGLMTGTAAGWSMFYFAGMFFNDEPLSNLSTGLIWALNAFTWWAISGLLTPNIYQQRERRTHDSKLAEAPSLDQA